MTDDRASPRPMAEIHGYAGGRWTLVEAMAATPREAVLRRARAISAAGRVQGVRVVMERTDEDGGTRAFVAWRGQKAEGVPELDLSTARSDGAGAASRHVPRTAPEPAPAPPSPPAPLPAPPDRASGRATGPHPRRPGRRTIRLAALAVLASAALTALLAAGRSDMAGNGALLLGTGAGLVLMASGLWIARDLLRIDAPAPAGMASRAEADAETPGRPADPIVPRPQERDPEETAAPPSAAADPARPSHREEPDRVALLPVLRLTASALRRLEEEGGNLGAENEGKLALRLYIAGACDERAARLGMASGSLVAGGLELLGEDAGDTAAFAGALDDALLSPGHQILYRAGRMDLAAFAQDGTIAPGLHRLLPGWLAWCGEGAGNRPAAPCAVLAVAPLAPRSIPAVEAVVRAFGGEPFSRDGTALVAGFADLSAAHAVAEAVRDAGSGAQGPVPGCGLSMAAPQRPGHLPAHRPVAEALALARGAPGTVSIAAGVPAAGIPAA